MNADHEEAVEFAKISKRENRVYVGNLSYDVKYRDLMEFMRGGGWGNFSLFDIVWGGVWLWGSSVGIVARYVRVSQSVMDFQQASPINWSRREWGG